MLILSMDSSAKPASVAVCRVLGEASPGTPGVELLGQYFQNSGLTHSRTLLAMAESLLSNLGISTNDIGLVTVSRGPGSFTGIRIGVSAAKGLAWGMDKPVCGVSTLEAMAYQTPDSGVIICPVMDARRAQVYNALFEWRDGKLVRLCDDRAISLEDLAAGLSTVDFILVGDGAAISYDYFSSVGLSCTMAPELMRYQTAYGVALAAVNAEQISAVDLEPSYLRPSQAERERG
jgi:tRNA threonylcarbamoyladenosine biosynthesis protein TsaB